MLYLEGDKSPCPKNRHHANHSSAKNPVGTRHDQDQFSFQVLRHRSPRSTACREHMLQQLMDVAERCDGMRVDMAAA